MAPRVCRTLGCHADTLRDAVVLAGRETCQVADKVCLFPVGCPLRAERRAIGVKRAQGSAPSVISRAADLISLPNGRDASAPTCHNCLPK
jgi:hypothetical protein